MAFFPDVKPNDKFKPSASLSNNVRRLVNSLNGFRGNGIRGVSSGVTRIQVYNNTAADIAAGCAVNFIDGGDLCGDAVPAKPLTDAAKPWGVVPMKLAAKQMGDCIIGGPVTVTLSGSGDYAAPTAATPAVFTRGTTGAPLLFASGTTGMILLGGGAESGYNGYFKVIKAGNDYRVVDGGNVSSPYCGKTDVGDVPAASLGDVRGKTVYLIVTYGRASEGATSDTYLFRFDTVLPDSSQKFGMAVIATVNTGGAIIQHWKDGAIYFGSRYYI